MRNIIIAIGIILSGFTLFAQHADNLLTNYVNIKNALVNGESKQVTQHSQTLLQLIRSEDHFPQQAKLVKATEKLAKAESLEKQRALFNEVSVLIWEVVKKSGQLSQPVYYQYCPMKKAYWLSHEKDIKNPYYGSSMLTCGRVVETKK